VNRQKRLDFAYKHINKPVDYWKSILWSDESPFQYIMKGRERCWRLPHERYLSHCITATVKHEKKINVWGCFSVNGVGNLYLIDGILDAEKYVTILENEMLPSKTKLFGRRKFIFQQDNDPKHTANVTKDWLVMKKVKRLDWPPQSPDLNPIENLWSILDRSVKNRRPNSNEELFDILHKAWNSIEVELLETLALSMPRRLQAVIDNNGWQTKY
jgi:hypothetical protein